MHAPNDFPYMIDSLRHENGLPTVPQRMPCHAANTHGEVILFRPQNRLDVLRCAAQISADASVQCLLLALPEPNVTAPHPITEADLQAWATEAESHAKRPCGVLTEGATFPCGQRARCHADAYALANEQTQQLTSLLTRSDAVEQAIDVAFPTLSPKHRTVIKQWATLEDPIHPGIPIRNRELATRFTVSERQIERVLQKAHAANTSVYRKLEALRDFRYRPNNAYEVRE